MGIRAAASWAQGLAGLRNFKMNWSVRPRIAGSNTFAVRGSDG
jgi:hypothetical protein